MTGHDDNKHNIYYYDLLYHMSMMILISLSCIMVCDGRPVNLITDKPFIFNATFRLAENYPVDLYFVMDVSQSMKEDKTTLASLGQDIGKNNHH